jgi:hypothetical protein
MSYSEDVEAIARYVTSEPARTPEAKQLKDDFVKWYDKVAHSWYVSEDDFREASNRRNEFNLRNAVTTVQKQATEQTIKTGLTSNEMQGGVKTQLSTGYYAPPEEHWYDSIVKNPLATVGAIGVAVVVLGGAAYLLPTLITGTVLTRHYRR